MKQTPKPAQAGGDRRNGTIRTALVAAGIFLAGGAAGWLASSVSSGGLDLPPDEESSRLVQEVRQGGYKYINPLLECEFTQSSRLGVAVPFGAELKRYVNDRLAEAKLSHISVYFRDLNLGPWLGVNEKENFSPASLLKVPILMGYMKMAEMDAGLMNKKLLFEGDPEKTRQNIEPGRNIELGKEYTVNELLYRMIAYSDNHAKNLLVMHMPPETLDRVYLDLGIEIPGVRSSEDFMSVRDYASFFRVLYNASYLNKESSEKALMLLSESEFKEGLAAGVPVGVQIAHKFGERGFADSMTKQLHDCGVVYYPGNPYLLCVMTRGTDLAVQKTIIAGISKIAYDGMQKKVGEAGK